VPIYVPGSAALAPIPQGQRPGVDLSSQTYLTLAQAAEYLQLGAGALQKQMERNAIPVWTWTRVGRSYRFLRPALDEWMQEKYRAVRKGKNQSVA
jgi:excisionase family DNA binding protein